jgi:adenine-specific DNA-methyltransferase
VARIHELLAQLRATAPSLAADIEREVDALANRRAFGLNFERHTPEAVELPGRRVRVGEKVRVLPPRGERPSAVTRQLFRVESIERGDAGPVATIAPLVAEFENSDAGDQSRLVLVDDGTGPRRARSPLRNHNQPA